MVSIYLLKLNSRNTRTMCNVRSKLTMKVLVWLQWRRCSGVFIVNFEQISHIAIALVVPLLNLSKPMLSGKSKMMSCQTQIKNVLFMNNAIDFTRIIWCPPELSGALFDSIYLQLQSCRVVDSLIKPILWYIRCLIFFPIPNTNITLKLGFIYNS